MGIQRWRKRPVEIEAMQVDGDLSIARIVGWMAFYNVHVEVVGGERPFGLAIQTLEGTMVASQGDYVIRGVHGEFYPCKPDIFRASYEQVV